MLISKAHAALAETSEELIDLANVPTPMEAFLWNMGPIVLLVILFYVLLIMPQQRRFKEHSDMLSDLKKGDRVVTGGGLVGKIDTLIDDKEVLIDLGNGTKVTALRSMIQGKTELKPVASDTKKAAPKKKAEAKTASKTKTTKDTKKA
ncbi:MAG: preprotein translocase subunit YajC [Alphaproteobacteria bacterium]|nr:MAG: preprotein translocase subunit YajC [Alphaproteobacteria bacterium]